MPEQSDLAQRIRADKGEMTRAFRKVASYLDENPDHFVSSPIRELSEAIGVSEPTLIRFSRHYGFKGFPDLRIALAISLAGAEAMRPELTEPSILDKELVNRGAKRAIAQAAFTFLEAEETILLDSGSTVSCLADKLVAAPATTILTTSINTLLKLRAARQHILMMPGGVLRASAMSLGGRMAEGVLFGMSFDAGFFGADSVHPEFGISTYSEDEAHLNRAMIRASRRVIVLADSSKFRAPALHKICDVGAIDMLITDDGLPDTLRDAFHAVGTELVIVSRDGNSS